MVESDKANYRDAGAGELFFIGLPSVELDQATRSLLEEVRPGGICLFARNIHTAEQTRELTDSIREVLGEGVLISIDQEGGRVDRLRRILEPMPAAESLRSLDDVRVHAELTSRALVNLGINMNFAPVVDVDGPDRSCASNGLATRIYGCNADDVVKFADEYIATLSRAGIKTCLKHFPGLGKSRVDSHDELPVVEIDVSELADLDLVPYRKARFNGSSTAVMVAHAAYRGHPLQAFESDGKPVPSSLGGGFISECLRNDIGFDGVVITDDLEMGAILKNYGIGQACVLALEAGNDKLLICNDAANIRTGFEAVLRAIDSGRLSEERIASSRARISALKGIPSAPKAFDAAAITALSEEIKAFKVSINR